MPRIKIDPQRIKEVDDGPVLWPEPLGESELEILWQQTRPDLGPCGDRVHQLASRKDDRFAWKSLALGYRIAAIKVLLERELRDVGVDKVLRLIREYDSELWGDGLRAFLETADEQLRSTGPLKRPPIPQEMGGMAGYPGYDD